VASLLTHEDPNTRRYGPISIINGRDVVKVNISPEAAASMDAGRRYPFLKAIASSGIHRSARATKAGLSYLATFGDNAKEQLTLLSIGNVGGYA
jgi:hypothetical protein